MDDRIAVEALRNDIDSPRGHEDECQQRDATFEHHERLRKWRKWWQVGLKAVAVLNARDR
jgi:hypothetical protein